MAKLNEELQIILDTLKKDGFFIDNHNGEKTNLTGGYFDLIIAKWYRARRPEDCELVPLFDCRGCSVNPLYLDKDGHVHLSTGSIGGVVVYNDIAKYNQDRIDNPHFMQDRLELVWDPTEEVA